MPDNSLRTKPGGSLIAAVREALACRTRHDGPPLEEGETLRPGCPACDAVEALNEIQLALEIAYMLLDGEGYFSDPDYPEAQRVAVALGR